VIMASPSFAATTKKANKAAKTTSTATTNNTAAATTDNSNTYTSNHSTSSINWNAAFGLGSIGSQFQFGPLVNGMISVANMEAGEIFVGGQTGFLYGPGTVTTWCIPIMAASQMNFKSTGKITPYAGLAMGVGIFHGGVSVSILGTTYGASSTSTDFAMLAKGGIKFGEDQKYFAELPLGTMGSAFAVFPNVGMKF